MKTNELHNVALNLFNHIVITAKTPIYGAFYYFYYFILSTTIYYPCVLLCLISVSELEYSIFWASVKGLGSHKA